jgi:hypothetical protein
VTYPVHREMGVVLRTTTPFFSLDAVFKKGDYFLENLA